MSKKTPIKKTKRRLKRTVRRSLAAVLMITAIGVAAIPVPENVAADDTQTDVQADERIIPEYTETVLDNISYDPVVSEQVYSLDVYEGGLYWQYRIDKTSKKVLQYNSSYPATSLTLNDTVPLNFYYVKNSEYESFINKEYTMKVSEYYDSSKTDSKTKDFFKTYFSNDTDYKEFMRKVAEYSGDESDAHGNDSITKHGYDLSDKDSRIYYCNSELLLEDHILMPITNQISDSAVITQIDEAYNPGGSGNSFSGATLVYIPYFIGENKPAGFSATHDAKGYYLYQNTSSESIATTQKITQIGKYAFASAGVLQSIDLPDWLQEIGIGAFYNCYNLKSVNIPFLVEVPEGAFKNCVNLKTVNWWMTGDDGKKSSGLSKIGKEAFYGSDVEESEEGSGVLTFPVGITEIGDAAFFGCGASRIKFDSARTIGVKINKYAFFDSTELSNIDFTEKRIDSLGDYCLAVRMSKNLMTEFVFPNSSFTTGKEILANRTALTKVLVPENVSNLKGDILSGCANLKEVQFLGVNTTYDKELFNDVTNEEFCVSGYATMNIADTTDNVSNASNPRRSTWSAEKTAVGRDVPYKFTLNGKEYYEVGNGIYLFCINKEDGLLLSCKFALNADISDWNGEVVIPPIVGNTKVTGIASNCFNDSTLNERATSLVIEDGSAITEIQSGAFQGGGGDNEKDWQKLRTVKIGNSVTKIGDNAFKDCISLVDVTFSTPSAGYDNFTIGKDAFKTGSDELTFHGDIVEGYAPFKWAMDKDNIIQESDNGNIRVCYVGLSDYLTVMYNPVTDMVTLLDYPKYSQIEKTLYELHKDEIVDSGCTTYNQWKEKEWYEKYKDEEGNTYREQFAVAWKEAINSEEAVREEKKKAVYASELYGPWINADNKSNWWSWLPPTDTSENTLVDWLFEPMVVYATDTPDAYYDRYPYDPVDNLASNDPYRAPTTEEQNLVYATQVINVPKGVDSIDVYGYIKNLTADGEPTTGRDRNTGNYNTYLRSKLDDETWRMYEIPRRDTNHSEDDKTTIEPGLFSGYYVDYTASNEKEKCYRGNDLITSVILNSVKYLPDYAFDSCENLQYVVLGKDCKDIGTAPFRGCTSLTTVGDNDYYKTNNGIVYSVNTDGSYTIEECLPARGNLVGGAQLSLSTDANLGNVSVIKDGAFEECKYINLIDLSDTAGLKDIPKNCFRNCEDLTRLSLPRSVNNIEEGAFANDLKLVELTIPGTEVFISAQAFDADSVDKKAWTTILTYADSSARRYADTYKDTYKLTYEQKKDEWRVIFLDSDLNQVGDAQYVEDNTFISDVPTCPAKDNWTFEKWLGTNNVEVTDRITSDTTFVAQGYSDNGMVNGKYTVAFYDQVDGTQIGTTQYVEPGQAAIAPQAPVHTGYTFLKWSSEEYTNVQKNLTIMAMYSGGSATTSGGSTTTSGGTTTTSGSTTSTSSSSSNTSTSSSSSNTSSSSNSSNTSGSGSTTGTYAVTVVNGSGSGSYAVGSTVTITANTPAEGMVFQKWTTESNGVTLASVSLSTTTFVMPANAVTVTANYVAGNGATAATTGTGNGGSTTGNNGNTVVDITKPGISNKDLATANVNGSTDNFVIKISETDEATRAVAAALTNKYGSLDNILYYAMDITLYDSTGTTKITDTSGLSIDITIPIPDALVAYGGNNMAGAVINGDQLEELNESFTTINGVPCVRFTATHFSPYTIYVDTGNLTEGMLDVTPKTGDPIHPKWFLSIGLACLSIILFLKKDKKVKVKTA